MACCVSKSRPPESTPSTTCSSFCSPAARTEPQVRLRSVIGCPGSSTRRRAHGRASHWSARRKGTSKCATNCREVSARYQCLDPLRQQAPLSHRPKAGDSSAGRCAAMLRRSRRALLRRLQELASANLNVVSTLSRQFASLPFDDAAAVIYGRIRAQLAAAGALIGPYDLQIAALALANNLTVVTRNLQQFETGRGDYARERHAWVDGLSLERLRAVARAK